MPQCAKSRHSDQGDKQTFVGMPKIDQVSQTRRTPNADHFSASAANDSGRPLVAIRSADFQ